MKQFNELGIKAPVKGFEGDKVSIETILDKNITVLGHRIVNSNYEKGNGKCLHLQVEFNGEKRVLFSGSGYLMETIELVSKEDFPFVTRIIKSNKRLAFS